MKPHPYLRAYMAGITVPSIFLVFVFGFFFVARFIEGVAYPLERVVVFPLGLVPTIWGLWNMLWVAMHGRRLPLGVHGGIAPLFVLPLSVWAARSLGFEFLVPAATILIVGLPGLFAIYYLLWKYLVGYLNEFLGVA